MILDDLLATLKERNIKLNVENGKLRYRGPEQELTPEVIGELRQWKDELIAREAKSQVSSNLEIETTAHIVPKRRRRNAVELAPSQEPFWLLHRLDSENISNNISIGWAFKGRLDRAALQAACDGLIDRHEALRVRIVERDNKGWLEVQKSTVALVETQSLSEVEPDRRSAEQDRLCTEFVCRPYDFSRAPLFRFLLLELETDHHVMVWGAHHIIGDGISWQVLQNDFEAMYVAHQQGEPADLSDVTVHLTDFAGWQRSQLTENEQQELEQHWKSVLPADLPPLELPTDHQRPALQSFEGRTLPISLPADLVSGIRDRAREQGCTLNMILMACLKTVFHRVSGQEDIVVGVPLSLRDTPELANVVGPLLNTLPMRTNFSGDPTFNELLKRERSTLLDALAHHDLPFLQLLQSVQPVRDASRNPLFQVVCETLSEREFQLPGLEANEIFLEGKRAQVDLTMHFRECATGVSGFVEYNNDLFESETIERLLGHFRTVIEAVAKCGDLLVSEIPLLSEPERREILVDWNSTDCDYPVDMTLPELFEAQAAQTPNAIALIYEDVELTYAELDRRSNQLARYLIDQGIGPEMPVGLYMERSIELIIGIYGILKAGGAYMPLDPEYPSERISFMLSESQTTLVLSQAHLEAQLPTERPDVLCLDRDWSLISRVSHQRLEPRATSDNLAYIIYTSGSTGRPKGVMVEHRSSCNQMLWFQEEFKIQSDDTVLQKTPFSFDVSTCEFFWPLLFGARLVVAKPGGHRDSSYLAQQIRKHEVTIVQFVPTMLEIFLNDDVASQCKGLRRVICAGEALSTSLRQRFFEHLDCELYNLYGPTEAAVHATYWACQRGSDRNAVPIGRPVANTQIYILDKHLQPVPIGTNGELHIGGVQVARGYLNRSDLTTDRFISDPFAGTSEGRLYKTGDLCRYRSDGSVEYVGRIDHQVKIRGLRIELGEIETAIAESSDTSVQVIVNIWSPQPSDVRLVAYIETKGAGNLDFGELREKLRNRLPEYMIPQHFIEIEDFPTTASGKTDRKLLPAPSEIEADREIAPARTPKEELLFKVWGEVLGTSDVSRTDNFFDAGGHSLLAMELIGRIHSEFGVEVTFRTLLRSTLGDLTKELAADSPEQGQALIPRMPRDEAGVELFGPQEPLWFVHQLSPENVSDHMQVGWTIEGELDHAALQGAFDALIRRHESLRVRIEDHGGRGRIQIEEPFAANLNFQSLSNIEYKKRAAEQHRICAEIIDEPFDFSCAPLFRIKLFELEPNRFLLLWVMHHIIGDGVSWGILQDELAEHYEALRKTGELAKLPDLRVQYSDFVMWQRSRLTADRLDELQNYWRSALPADLPPLELPTDHPRPSLQTFNGSSVPIELPSEVTDVMRVRSKEQGCSLIVTIITCLKALLHRISGQEEIVVGVPVALRDNVDLTNMVGLLLNTLPIRTSFSENCTFREILEREQNAFLSTLDHKDLPFNQIVKTVQPARDPSRNPLFQVMFEMMPASEFGLSELKTNLIEPQYGGAQFDLSFYLWEYPDGIKGFVQYNTALFEGAAIERLVKQFETVIGAVAQNLDLRVSEIPLLSDAQQHEMLIDWNATEAKFAKEKGLHHLFEEQVRRDPSAPALVFDGRELSYEELNKRSNKLANHLRSLGIGPDKLVGLCVERSIDLVIGALGILKAGGAYVPMDPTYPKQRLAFMLEDTEAKVILTQSHLVDELPPHQAELLCLDADWEEIDTHSSEVPLDISFRSDQLAYVIFTSGSTGRPKGVMVEHRNASNFINGMDEAMHPGRSLASMRQNPGVWLAVTSLSFDPSVLDLFWTLSRGFKVVLYSAQLDQERKEEQSIPALVAAHSVTHMQCVPTMVRMLLSDAEGVEALLTVDKLLIGGEALTGQMAADLQAHMSGDVINVYGPTETTVWCSAYTVQSAHEMVPIGKPIANMQFYVLDSYGQPAPIGVPGELYIGGEGVTRGYIGRPDLTEERFVANTFDGSGSRLYRTGDRVTYQSDGNLTYLGRVDFQVKIRGHRIELGEIETAIVQSATVPVHTVVTTWSPEASDVRLVAYIETEDSANLQIDRLREKLRDRLSNYMVPQHFVVMEKFPKTASGKVDRNQLPTPTIEGTAGRLPSISAVEQQMIGLWQNCLHVQSIGPSDNFFDLGGHSLSAVQLAADISRVFKVPFSPRHLMQEPELHAISRYVEQALSGQSQADGKRAIDTDRQITMIDSNLSARRQPLATDSAITAPAISSKENRWRGIKNRILQIIALYAPGSQTWRVRLHRARGVTMGEKVTIGTSAILETSSPHLIEIGSKVQIGIRAVFIAHMGDMTPAELKTKPTIRIEDEVYIGPGVIILPNVTIGRGSVVAAGSVVNRSIPPETFVQGNPAAPMARCRSPLAWNSYQDFALNLEPLENVAIDTGRTKNENIRSIDGGLEKQVAGNRRPS